MPVKVTNVLFYHCQARLPTGADAEMLCSDLQLFSEVFVVSASPMSPSDLQYLVCDVVNLDFEKVLDEVQNNRASVREFLDAVRPGLTVSCCGFFLLCLQ